MSNDLVRRVDELDDGVSALEQFIAQLPALPTDQLVTGFVAVDAMTKKAVKFTDAVKKVLVTNAKDDVPASGRFMTDIEVEEDEKGHLYLFGVQGERLQAQKRVSVKFNAEKTAALLGERDLWEQGTDVVETVAPLDEVKQTIDLIDTHLDDAVASIDGSDCAVVSRAMLEDLQFLVGSLLRIERKVSEQKVEALVTLGLLPLDDVERLVDTQVTYAVIPPKAKK